MSGLSLILRRAAGAALIALALSGCALQSLEPAPASAPTLRPFSFERDTYAFANELEWTYGPHGTHKINDNRPLDYGHRCFIMTSGVRQFRMHARFEPRQPRLAGTDAYRALVREVYARSRRTTQPDINPVVIPGYADLRDFSAAWGQVLRDESGSGFSSYFERGNWRLVFPFSRDHQRRTLDLLLAALDRGEQPILHLVRFPNITINHAVLVFGAKQTAKAVRLRIYDPNHPEHPMELVYQRETRTFEFAANNYFEGGRVDVYEIFTGLAF